MTKQRGRGGLNFPALAAILLLALCACFGTLSLAVQVHPARSGRSSNLIMVEACVGLVVGRNRVGVWWSSPRVSAVPPVAFASRYAFCGHVPLPTFIAERGNLTFSP